MHLNEERKKENNLVKFIVFFQVHTFVANSKNHTKNIAKQIGKKGC